MSGITVIIVHLMLISIILLRVISLFIVCQCFMRNFESFYEHHASYKDCQLERMLVMDRVQITLPAPDNGNLDD